MRIFKDPVILSGTAFLAYMTRVSGCVTIVAVLFSIVDQVSQYFEPHSLDIRSVRSRKHGCVLRFNISRHTLMCPLYLQHPSSSSLLTRPISSSPAPSPSPSLPTPHTASSPSSAPRRSFIQCSCSSFALRISSREPLMSTLTMMSVRRLWTNKVQLWAAHSYWSRWVS